MEESEKRKERLKAMRMEASEVGSYVEIRSPGSASGLLSNPLIENETFSASPSQYNSPRFDYYTDPMAAFSGGRRSGVSSEASQGHYNTPPRPFHQGMIRSPSYNYRPPVTSPGLGMPNPPRAQFHQISPIGPMGAASPSNAPQQNPPGSWASPSPSPSRGPMNSPQYDSGYWRKRGPPSGFSPSPGSGSMGRGGPRDSIPADERPDLYYKKEMVQDPWESLIPIVWNQQSWLPKSIPVKKSKASPQASIPQQSLAEYLATTFDDSTG